MAKRLRFYVWEGVLEDYSSGIVCVVATSALQAWELLKERDPTAYWVLQGHPEDRQAKTSLTEGTQPREVAEAEAFVVWGGS